MTGEDLALEILAVFAEDHMGDAAIAAWVRRGQAMKDIIAACAKARAEGRAEVQREWDDAEITRGEYDE